MDLAVNIKGTGHAVGSAVVSNAELSTFLGLPENWLLHRTGIVERRVCGEGEDVTTLARDAVHAALEASSVAVNDIAEETLLLHIQNGMVCMTPPSGIVLAEALGLPTARVLAIDGVCAEPVAALEIAAVMLDTVRCERVIVSAAANFLPIVNPKDRDTVGLFGAGAGAVVLQRATAGASAQTIRSLLWKTLPQHAGLGRIPITGYAFRSDGVDVQTGYYDMDGTGLARVALQVLPQVVTDVLAQAGWTHGDVDLVISHQPNVKLLDMGMRALGFDPSTVPTPVKHLGNMGPASLLVNLSLADDDGLMKPGTRLLLLTFGLGFSCGAAAVEL